MKPRLGAGHNVYVLKDGNWWISNKILGPKQRTAAVSRQNKNSRPFDRAERAVAMDGGS
jgi:hypothetical protein